MGVFFMQHGAWMTGIILLIGASLFCQSLMGYHLYKMMKESEFMEYGNPVYFRECVEYFCKKQSKGREIINLQVFLDKYFSEIKIGKVTLNQLKHGSGQLIMLSVLLAGLGACKGIIDGETLGEILPYYIVSLLGLYLHFAVSGLLAVEEKKKLIKIRLMDYLENRRQQEEIIHFGKREAVELEELLQEILT